MSPDWPHHFGVTFEVDQGHRLTARRLFVSAAPHSQFRDVPNAVAVARFDEER
jgi:hypothetical protein